MGDTGIKIQQNRFPCPGIYVKNMPNAGKQMYLSYPYDGYRSRPPETIHQPSIYEKGPYYTGKDHPNAARPLAQKTGLHGSPDTLNNVCAKTQDQGWQGPPASLTIDKKIRPAIGCRKIKNRLEPSARE
jgi:hypothetical protein